MRRIDGKANIKRVNELERSAICGLNCANNCHIDGTIAVGFEEIIKNELIGIITYNFLVLHYQAGINIQKLHKLVCTRRLLQPL